MQNKDNYLELDVFEYISPKARIFFEPKFRTKLFRNCIEKFGTNRKFSKILGINETSTREWRIGKKLPPLWAVQKMANMSNIKDQEVRKNTLWITNYFREGKIFITDWKILFNEKLTEWLGLLYGDGVVTIDYVSIINNDLDVIFFFKNCLENIFGIETSQMEITIRYSPEVTKNNELKDLENLFKENKISRIKFDKNSGGFKRNEPNMVLRVSSRVLSKLVKNIENKSHEFLTLSNKETKAGYVKGFSAAEGSVYDSRGQRAISISQKDREKLEFIKILMSDIGIENIKGPLNIRDKFQITVTTRKEIENFQKNIGFGCHIKKNKELQRVLSLYHKDLPYKTPKKSRYDSVIKLIEENKRINSINLANSLQLKHKYVNKLLNEMLDKKLIHVNTESKPFTYFLEVDKVEG